MGNGKGVGLWSGNIEIIMRAQNRADLLEQVQELYKKAPVFLEYIINIDKLEFELKKQYNILLGEPY